MDECIFKVGQRVWCFMFGWGVIYGIANYDTCPVRVEFEGVGKTQRFTADGKWNTNQSRTLFFSEIPIPPEALVPPKPKRKLIPAGSAVEVKVDEVGGWKRILTIVAEDNDPENPPTLMLPGGVLIDRREVIELLRIWHPAKAA